MSRLNWSNIIVLIFLLLGPVAVCGKCVISGRVTTPDRLPVDGAIVRLLDGKTTLAYTVSTDQGAYSLTTETGSAKTIRLMAEALGYATSCDTIPAATATRNIILAPQQLVLKEVSVSAPSINERGDTLVYNLKSFVGKGDVTLRDALGKLPGVDVASTGEVKYQGKAISQFKIEGLDLLGGKYNVATNNIPASCVKTVEIISGHHDRKIDRDRFSDDVALNIRLEPWARFKPIGTCEATAGRGDDAWLYRLSGAGMMFNSSFQAILTAKLGNTAAFAADEHVIHYGKTADNPSAVNLLGNLSAAAPPFSKNRYISPTDRSVSLNLINKRGEDATWRTNVDYAYSRERFSSASMTEYFLPGSGKITMTQSSSSRSTEHNPALAVEYRLDNENQFISNKFSARASILRNSLPVTANDLEYGQRQRFDGYSLADEFSTTLRHGGTKWHISARANYLVSPTGTITVSGAENILQTASSARFNASGRVSASWSRLRSTLFLPVGFTLSSDRLTTRLDEDRAVNRLHGENFRIKVEPTYEYAHPESLLSLRATASAWWEYYDYRNTGSSPVTARKFRPGISPRVYLTCRPVAPSTFTLSADWEYRTGDILDLLTAPVQTDYLSSSTRTGLIADSRTLSGFMAYKFQKPVEMFFFNASLNASRRHSNLIAGQEITTGSVNTVAFAIPNDADFVSASLSATKQISPIRTKLTLAASGSWSRSVTVQNSDDVAYFGRSYTLSPAVNARPWSWIEVDYRGDIGRTFSRFPGNHSSYFVQTHRLSMSVYPIEGLELRARADLSGRELAEGTTKRMTLADLRVRYRFGRFRLTAEVNNIFDTRRYDYTIFDGINRHTASYSLRGREFLLTISFSK